jgi:hypothetical protein
MCGLGFRKFGKKELLIEIMLLMFFMYENELKNKEISQRREGDLIWSKFYV